MPIVIRGSMRPGHNATVQRLTGSRAIGLMEELP
jgi:hypothetical protein